MNKQKNNYWCGLKAWKIGKVNIVKCTKPIKGWENFYNGEKAYKKWFNNPIFHHYKRPGAFGYKQERHFLILLWFFFTWDV